MNINNYMNAAGGFSASGTGGGSATPTDPLGQPPAAASALWDSQCIGFDFRPFASLDIQLSSGAATGGAGTPVSTVKFQMSDDNVNWFDVITFTGTTTGASVERKSVVASATVQLGRWGRFSPTVGSASGTASYAYTYIIIGRHI